MFDTLVESRPSPLGLSRWGVVCAVALHAAAVGVALRTPAPVHAEPPTIFIDQAPSEPSPTVHRGPLPAPVLVEQGADVRGLVLPPVEPIPGIPDLAGPAPIGPGDPASAPLDPAQDGDGGPLCECLVQERPELLAGPPPAYPPALREAGVEGDVVIQVVVDTLGRPEPASARIVQHAAPGFETSALRAILAARFRPARVWGRAVRVLVQVPVAFNLHR
jgi:periplasmic protein TonB